MLNQFVCSIQIKSPKELKHKRRAFEGSVIPSSLVGYCTLFGASKACGNKHVEVGVGFHQIQACFFFETDVLDKVPYAFIDLHGHSKCFNVFVYGNNPEESWNSADQLSKNSDYLTLPEILHQVTFRGFFFYSETL